jgi:hypothetical protein
MAQELDPPTLTIRWEDLREILRVDQPKLNEVAIDLCGLLGLPLAHGLVVEMVSTKNPPGFRIRAAKALERVGAIDEADWLRLAPIIFVREEITVPVASGQLKLVLSWVSEEA